MVDRGTGIAFISADPRLEDGKPDGGIYAYDLNREHDPERDMEPSVRGGPGFSFHPHGMGLFIAPGGERRLFVVNHRKDRTDVVEIFRVDGMRLVRVDSAQGPPLVRGNDVVPVGPKSFYVSNTLSSSSRIGQAWERVTGQRRSSVLYYDGAGFTSVTGRLPFANGVNLSRDGRRLYVATTGGKELLVYDRVTDSTLVLRHPPIPLGRGADNIDVDESGDVWVARHLNLRAFFFYMLGARDSSPAEVLYLPESDGRVGEAELVARNGPLPPATSVAVRHGRRLLIGSVADVFLVCALTGVADAAPAAR